MSNSFLFVNATKIYHIKSGDSEMKKYHLYLRNMSGEFPAKNMKKNRIKWECLDFPVDYKAFDISDIISIY